MPWSVDRRPLPSWTGVGTAWITHGPQGRTDIEVLTVEIDPAIAGLAAANDWPGRVRLITGDAVNIIRRSGNFDLIFADAQGGKWEGLDTTVAARRPGAKLRGDDMTPETFIDDNHARKDHQGPRPAARPPRPHRRRDRLVNRADPQHPSPQRETDSSTGPDDCSQTP